MAQQVGGRLHRGGMEQEKVEGGREAFATFLVRSERVGAVKMEGRNGCEKCFSQCQIPPNPLD